MRADATQPGAHPPLDDRVVLLLAVGALLFFAGNSVLAPFIYPFF